MATHRFRRAQPIIYGVAGIFIGAIASFFLNPVLRSPWRATTSPALPDSRLESLPINTPGRFMAFWSMHSEPHFLIQMIPHHQDAVAMADLTLSRAQHAELKQLAQSIKTTQTQEIQQMQTWYKQWYGTAVPEWAPAMGMHPRRTAMGREGMRVDLATLQTAPDFDRAFIEAMIPHHQMAIMMATMVENQAPHAEARELARSIIKTQSAEIAQMEQWYKAWYPS
jgi:uncharacterized protein (DUF305 family)